MLWLDRDMDELLIRTMQGDDEARAAAGIMARSPVWQVLKRSYDQIYSSLTSPNFEKLVAVQDGQVIGVVSMAITVPLIKGYIAALAVHEDWRGRGVGSRLLTAAEQRILHESPNVFLCVSSSNLDAQRFYQRHGYQHIGTIRDYVVAGGDELLMRKTTGPWATFVQK